MNIKLFIILIVLSLIGCDNSKRKKNDFYHTIISGIVGPAENPPTENPPTENSSIKGPLLEGSGSPAKGSPVAQISATRYAIGVKLDQEYIIDGWDFITLFSNEGDSAFDDIFCMEKEKPSRVYFRADSMGGLLFLAHDSNHNIALCDYYK